VIEKELVTLAYDTRTGRERWRRSVVPEKLETVHKFSSAAASTPCTDGRHGFAYFNSFGVVAYDFEGKEAWQRPLPMLPVQYGAASSPVLVDDRLIVQRDSRTASSHLLALDASTGRTLWDAARPLARDSHSTPMVWRHDSRRPEVDSSPALKFRFPTGRPHRADRRETHAGARFPRCQTCRLVFVIRSQTRGRRWTHAPVSCRAPRCLPILPPEK